jgi:hypothetical protein
MNMKRKIRGKRAKKLNKTQKYLGEIRWCSWLRHWATSRKVVVSNPDRITGIFQLLNPSGCGMALGSTQPLTVIKGKGFPLQAWCGSWRSRRLRLLDLLDFRHYEGGKVVTLTHQPSLPPGVFLVLIFRGWVDTRAHGSVGSFGKTPNDTTGDRSWDLPISSAVP